VQFLSHSVDDSPKMMEVCKMKIRFILGIATFIFLFGILIIAGIWSSSITTAAENNQSAESVSVENQIRENLEQYYQIARSNNRSALEKFSRELTAPEFVLSSESGKKDRATAFNLFASNNIQFIATEFDNLSIQVHGNTAIAKYRDSSVIRVNGDLQRTQTQLTNVWVKKNGKWLIVAEHRSNLAPLQKLPNQPITDNVAVDF
jgi:ketosteroid isomerase-like protein